MPIQVGMGFAPRRASRAVQIGPYILICELACGGMGQVWLALRLWPDGKQRSCVVKLPRRSAVTDEGVLLQFVEESRLAMLLRHDNIVSVFDVGEHEGLPYLVMDYVAGVDLAQLVRTEARLGKQWTVETAVHVVRAIAQALHYAHDFEVAGVHQQIVHRDVASKNVMIDGTGAVLLTDFGVATSIGTQTSRIHAKGTLPYMAPEHYLARASTASDVFGLGGILWELLAGRPFRGGLEGQALIEAVVAGAVEPVGRELPPKVRYVLDGMLHHDANQRITLPTVLVEFEDFPSRRLALKKMVSTSFGPQSRRTGHSQLHFVASKELLDTLAIAKVAGVSVPERHDRELTGQPARVPADFAPVTVHDTAKVDRGSLAARIDDEVQDGENTQNQTTGRVGSGAEGEPSRSEPTLRLPGELGAQRLAAVAAMNAAISPTAVVAAPAPPIAGGTQRTRLQLSAAAEQPSPFSSRGGTAVVEPALRPSRAPQSLLVISIAMLLLGLGIGILASWPEAEAVDRTTDAAVYTEASPPMQAPPERSETPAKLEVDMASPSERGAEEEPAATAELNAPAGDESQREQEQEQEREQEPPALAEPQASPTGTELDEPLLEPPPAPAKAKPRPAKPAPKLDLTVRSGLVAYAELKIGKGKPQVVPARGVLKLRVAPGTYTLRSRTSADGPWKTIRYTFSEGMAYACWVEQYGLRIGAEARKAR